MVAQFMPLMARSNESRLGCPSRSEGNGLSCLEASIVLGSVLIYMIVLAGKLSRFIGDAGAEVVVVASPPLLKQFCVLKYIGTTWTPRQPRKDEGREVACKGFGRGGQQNLFSDNLLRKKSLAKPFLNEYVRFQMLLMDSNP